MKRRDVYKRQGLYEAVVTGTAKLGGIKCALAIMDSNFFMGSMGQIVGEKITRCIEYATKKKLPLIIFCTSGGARMQEGILSLVQDVYKRQGLEHAVTKAIANSGKIVPCDEMIITSEGQLL